jgi:hypothetical protein
LIGARCSSVREPPHSLIPVRIMCGQSDYFVTATREFAKGVPDLVAADYPVGTHDPKLWASTAVAQLTLLANALG